MKIAKENVLQSKAKSLEHDLIDAETTSMLSATDINLIIRQKCLSDKNLSWQDKLFSPFISSSQALFSSANTSDITEKRWTYTDSTIIVGTVYSEVHVLKLAVHSSGTVGGRCLQPNFFFQVEKGTK